MTRLWLHDAVLCDPEAGTEAPGSLLLEAGRIAARLPATAAAPADARAVTLGGARLTPGLIDVHFHGELATCRTDDARAALLAASASLARHGVTAFLATTLAWPAEELTARVEALVAALDAGGWPGAVPFGIHLEGPWIRPEAAGAQPPGGIRPYEPREGAALFDRMDAWLRLVTLAPELPGARALETELARRGVTIAVGHTLADPESLAASVANGACHATHLFNAMGAHGHRAAAPAGTLVSGVAGRILAEERLGVDLIADGAHVHPDWLRIAAAAKPGRSILISDRIDVAPGAPPGWLDAERLHSDGVAWRLPDGRLAGSLLTLDDALRNVGRWRVMDRHDALAAATFRPARLVAAERERGTLRPGARADLVALDTDGRVRATWVGGREVHRAPV